MSTPGTKACRSTWGLARLPPFGCLLAGALAPHPRPSLNRPASVQARSPLALRSGVLHTGGAVRGENAVNLARGYPIPALAAADQTTFELALAKRLRVNLQSLKS